MRNLAGRPNPLDKSRGFSGSLRWRARGPGSLRSAGDWRGLAWLALGLAGISGCAWSPSFERSPLGDSASPHSIARPSAVETWRSELSTDATRDFPRSSSRYTRQTAAPHAMAVGNYADGSGRE